MCLHLVIPPQGRTPFSDRQRFMRKRRIEEAHAEKPTDADEVVEIAVDFLIHAGALGFGTLMGERRDRRYGVKEEGRRVEICCGALRATDWRHC